MVILPATVLAAHQIVSVCDAAHTPELWNREIEVQGTFTSGFESGYLYDPDWPTWDDTMSIRCAGAACDEPWPREPHSHDGVIEVGNRSAAVVLRGTLRPWDGYGYGHLGSHRLLFEYVELKSYQQVSDSSAPKLRPGPFLASVEAVRSIDRQVVDALLRGDASTQPWFEHGFRLATPPSPGSQEPEPACPKGILRWQRVFVEGALAIVRGSFRCFGSANHTQPRHHYLTVYQRSDGWQPVLGEFSWPVRYERQ